VRVPVTDLVGSPGATRRLTQSLRPEDIGSDPWGPAADALRGPIAVDLHLDSVVEGIFVHGDVAFDLQLDCARCLEPVSERQEVRVSELFQDPRKLDDGEEAEEGYVLVDDRTAIDLERMLHDIVILALPVRVTCREADCRPTLGDDVAVRTEDEELERRASEPDPRWQKLADLDLPTE
jgi:uncharacterized protein